jgi:Fe-S cluster assembly protein SufD
METIENPDVYALEKHFSELNQDTNLYRFQKDFWDRFQEVGLPTRKSESYQYTPLRTFLPQLEKQSSTANRGSLSASTGFNGVTLVFHNGVYNEEASDLTKLDDDVLIMPLEKAVKKFSMHIQARLQRNIQKEKDPLALLNQAFCSEGIFLYFPSDYTAKTPIRLLHILDQSAGLSQPSIFLFAGKGASATLFQETHQASDCEALNNQYIDFHLEKHAEVKLYSYQHAEGQGSLFQSVRAYLKEESDFKSFDFSCGALNRSDYHVTLAEPMAEGYLAGSWVLNKKDQAHTHVLMEHEAPSCISTQLFKGVLFDHAKSSFEGKIYVHQAAQKTESYQSNHNLLMSDHAFAASKPNLEIFADDVKASHGSTVGQLDEDQLFYMETRGIPKDQAKHLLIEAFCRDVVTHIEDKNWKEMIMEKFLHKLPQKNS